jgi:hypothetical protein
MLKRIAIAAVAAMLGLPAQAQRCELRSDLHDLQQKADALITQQPDLRRSLRSQISMLTSRMNIMASLLEAYWRDCPERYGRGAQDDLVTRALDLRTYAFSDCLIIQTPRLDDGISDVTAIARTIMDTCGLDRILETLVTDSEIRHSLTLSSDKHDDTKAVAATHFRDGVIKTILENRATRRR